MSGHAKKVTRIIVIINRNSCFVKYSAKNNNRAAAMNDSNHPHGRNSKDGHDSSPEMHPEAACADAQEPRWILEDAIEASPGDDDDDDDEEEFTTALTAASASSIDASSGVDAHPPPPSDDRHAFLPDATRREWPRLEYMRQSSLDVGPWIPLALAVLFQVSYLARRYHQHRRDEIDWRRSSSDTLEMLRGRIHDEVHVQKYDPTTGNTEKLEVDDIASEARRASNAQGGVWKEDDSDQSIGGRNNRPKHGVIDTQSASHRLPEIRIKQQEHRNATNVSNRRPIKREKIEKELTLHSSLDHHAADDAHQRRMNVIAEERRLLRSRAAQEGEQRRVNNDKEEMERIALLRQQNFEYEESLRIDRNRSRQLELMGEITTRRKKSLSNARERLVASGVHSDAVALDGRKTLENVDTNHIKVRLLLPSGQKIDGSFSAKHVVSLVYDLALLALDKSDRLWSRDGGHDGVINGPNAADGDICSFC